MTLYNLAALIFSGLCAAIIRSTFRAIERSL